MELVRSVTIGDGAEDGCPCSSVVERVLGKDEAAGSIPAEGSTGRTNSTAIQKRFDRPIPEEHAHTRP